MKKRILASLLAGALLLSLMVAPVGAETVATGDCLCGCGQNVEQIRWQPWKGEAATGHYYLEEDYVQDAQKTVNSGSSIVLDLRGHLLTTADYTRLFLVYGYLGIIDTAGGGCLSGKTSGAGVGGVFQVYYNNGDTGTLELRDVTLMPHKDNKSAKGGGLIYVGTGCDLKMDGCTLLNGTTTTSGGALHGAAGSRMQLRNSRIIGCSAAASGGSIYSAGTVELENTQVWGGKAGDFGGNLYQNGGSLRIDGCDIAYGVSESVGTTKYGGGNLCAVTAAVVDVEDSRIRDGYASYNGGNIYYTTGQYTFTDTVIQGGVAGLYGANLCAFSENTTTFENCDISGDVRFGAGALTLKGATKIGLRNNGLDLVGGGATVVVKAAELTAGAEIFVEANGVFAQAGAKAEYFKPAIRTGDITVNADGNLTALQATAGALGGYCPHCDQRVRWTQFGDETASDAFDADHNLASGHFYMNTNTAYLYKLPANVDFVLDINGKTMVGGQRLFRVTGTNASLSILDSVGGGKLTGKGVGGETGGVIVSAFDGFRLDIYGGQLGYVKHADKTITSGGVISVSGSNSYIGIYGGSIDGSAQANSTGTYGGAIYVGNNGTNKTFSMTAGRLVGGTTQYGGNLYLGHYVSAEITGGVLVGGTSTEGGGNLRINGNSATNRSAVSMKNCAVLDGTITGAFGGGNIYTLNGDVALENCYIGGGAASAGYGGNLSGGAASKVTATDTVFLSGSGTKGGNLYAAATNGEFLLDNCVFLCGNATNYGGNIFFNNGFNTVNGGMVAYGTAASLGGNIYTNAGNQANAGQYTKIQGDTLIAGGEATTKGGNLFTIGVTELTQLRLVSGTAALGSDLYLSKGGVKTQLTLDSGFSGTVGMGVDSVLLSENVYGGAIAETASGGISARITLEGDYGDPGILVKNGALCVGGTSVVDSRGMETWYATNAGAVAACGDEEFIRLYTSAPLALNRDLAVDLNGQTVTVSGDGMLYGMDSSGDGYTVPAGKAVWGDSSLISTPEYTDAPNGSTYFAIRDGGTVTYHRLNMAITDVVLRPGCAGLYYQAQWNCDDVLGAKISEYGIAVSLVGMPGEDFREDGDTLYTGYTTGEKQCSVLVENVFKSDAEAEANRLRGEMPIYATAYICFEEGKTYLSDRPGVTDDVCYSLHSFMELADQTIRADRITYRQTENRLDAFYEQWQTRGAGEWEFSLIKTPVAPQDDDVTKILILGQSLANDTAHLLYKVLKAERPDEKFLVVNIYRSVGLNEHVVNIKNRAAVYQKYTFTDAGMQTTSNVTLTEAVMQDNWDLITFNDATFPTTQAKEFEDGEHQFMIDHIRQYAEPGFKLGYNVTWADPTSALLYTPDRKAVPANYRENFTKYFGGSRNAYYSAICNNIAKYIEPNDAYDLVLYPGTAIQYASETHGVPEADPNRNYDLYRDYVHLSDLGRLIAAYQVYAQYFGLEELTSVNLDMVEADMRATYRETAFGDFILTQQHRDAIIASVNYALKNPNTDPPQTAREPAILEPLS